MLSFGYLPKEKLKRLIPLRNYRFCFFAHKFPPENPETQNEIDSEIALIRTAVDEFLGQWSMELFPTEEPGAWLSEE